MSTLTDKRIAILVATEGIEQVELTQPRQALLDAGATVDLLSVEEGQVQAFDHLTAADTFDVDRVVVPDLADDYDALMLPGGVANPDALRMHDDAVSFVGRIVEQGKPVAAICHASWTLVEADVVRDRTMTSWPSLQTDLRNAGATWVDEEVVVCEAAPSTLVTSRNPGDLDAFCAKMVERFAAA